MMKRKSDKEDDIALVGRACKGDESAFRILLRKYERSVYSICFRMVGDREEASDLAQEAFAKVFSMLDRYNPLYAFSSWLLKITSNLCIDFLRKRRVDSVPMDAPISSEKGNIVRQIRSKLDDPEMQVIKKERSIIIQEAIESLPPHYLIVILLRHQEGMSYEEIASSLDLPLGTVKARIHRARQMLRSKLEEEDLF